MKKILATALLVLAIGSAALLFSQGVVRPTAASHFTISGDTTLIEGPLNPDGTINYIPAMNDLIGGGIKNQDNAALLLLGVTAPSDPKRTAVFRELKWTAPAEGAPQLLQFEDYLRKQGIKTEASSNDTDKLYDLLKSLRKHPWKTADHTDVAAWLKESDSALAVIEQASKLPRYFIPFTSEQTPPNALDGLPLPGITLSLTNTLTTRAMLRAGEGDFAPALEDIKCVQRLARLVDQEHLEIFHLMVLAQEYAAMEAYAALAGNNSLDPDQLKQLRATIESLPPLPEFDATTDRMEEMLSLDTAMMFIRGDAQTFLRLSAFQFDKSKHIEEGDLSHLNWDVVLREITRDHEHDQAKPGQDYAKQLADVDEKAKTHSTPPISLFADGPTPAGGPIPAIDAVQSFLKMKPGETQEAYSRRLGSWISGWDPAMAKTLIFLNERPRLIRAMALTCVSIAEYRLAKGAYPSALKDMGEAILRDTFSGKDILYRREKEGFLLWSVGKNQKDDGGTADDIALGGGG